MIIFDSRTAICSARNGGTGTLDSKPIVVEPGYIALVELWPSQYPMKKGTTNELREMKFWFTKMIKHRMDCDDPNVCEETLFKIYRITDKTSRPDPQDDCPLRLGRLEDGYLEKVVLNEPGTYLIHSNCCDDLDCCGYMLINVEFIKAHFNTGFESNICYTWRSPY